MNHVPRRLSRRGFLVAGAAGVAGLAAGGAVREAYAFEVTRSRARLARRLAATRVALLTDLHYGTFVRVGSVRAWVDAALATGPDLVVLVGDLVDASVGPDVAPLIAELGRLAAPLGVFATWGNHDHSSGLDLPRFALELAAAGIEVLVNRGRDVGPLHLAGVDDLRAGSPDLDAALAGRAPDRPCVLLTHNPDILPRVPSSVDLTLAGHTHGGQVCLPGLGPIVTSSRYGRRFASGWVDGPARGYVSRGLGFSWVPVRVACRAELAVIDLEGEAAPPLDGGTGPRPVDTRG